MLITLPNWSGFGMNWIAPARMLVYGVKRLTASASVSPTCKPTPNTLSRRWRGSRPNWNRRGGRGGDGWSGVDSGDTEIGKAVGVHRETVRRIRKERRTVLHPT